MKPDWEAWRSLTARPGRQRPKNRECGLYLKCFSIQSSMHIDGPCNSLYCRKKRCGGRYVLRRRADGRKRDDRRLFLPVFRCGGGYLTAISMALFAFATIIAWFYLGRQAVAYLTEHSGAGKVFLCFYGFVYLNAVFFGCGEAGAGLEPVRRI